jgi:hypothetical protein
MMKDSCYRQAFATLKDSVSLVTTSQEPALDEDFARKMVREKLHNARQRISAPEISSTNMHIPLQVISHDAADTLLQQTTSGVDTPTVIRFETSDIDLIEETQDFDLQCAIILFNLAIVSLACSQQDRGARLLSSSGQILSDMFQRCQEKPYMLKRVVCISTIVLHALRTGQLARHQIADAEHSARSLEYLSDVASTLETSGLFSCHGGLLAAAA